MNLRLINNWFSRCSVVWFSLFLFYIWLSSKGSGFPELADIVVTALAALSILVKLYSGEGKGASFAFSLLLFAYVVYVTALLLIAPMPEYGLDKVLAAISILFLYIFFTLTIQDKKQIKSLQNALIFVVLSLSFLELLFIIPWYGAWLEISGSVLTLPPVSYRLEGIILTGANFTAAFLTLVLPFVVMRYITAHTNRSKCLWIACLVLIGIIEFFASSRGGWLAALGAVAVTLFLYFQPDLAKLSSKVRTRPSLRVGWARGTKVLGLLLLGVAIVFVFSLQVQATPGHAGVLSGRETIWSNALQIWSASFWTGQGAGTFPLFSAQQAALPPGWLADHAHNLWLHLGAESGVLGVALVVALALVLGISLLSAWRRNRADAHLRGELSAYIGVGVGILLANTADFYFHISLYAIYCVLLVSMAMKYTQPRVIQLPKIASYLGVSLILLFYLGGSWFSLNGVGEYIKGLLAYQAEDLQEANGLACAATDLAPQFSLYMFECGLTSAGLFFLEHKGPGLGQAKQLIEQGLDKDPYWPAYWADLAILEWELGAEPQAAAHMQTASAAAPQNALFALNLGWMAEQTGAQDSALAAYRQALAIDPWLIESLFFQTSEFRRSIVETFSQSELGEEAPLVLMAYRALQAGDLGSARDYLGLAHDEHPRDAQAWAMLGLLALKEGDSQAWTYAQTALFLDATNPRVLVWAADVANAQGQDSEAASLIEKAFDIWTSKVQYDTPRYYSAVYHRPAYGQNFVPGYVRADAIPGMLASFEWLAQFYRAHGNLTQADLVQRWLDIEATEMTGFSSSSD